MRLHFITAILLTALVLGAGLAHLYALPNKIGLPGEDYLAAQQVYRGWTLLGAFQAGALIAIAALAVRVRHAGGVFPLTLAAGICIALTLVLFFLFTFPANRATVNWTHLPANWEVLRTQWEYSHAANAVLELIALGLLAAAAVNWRAQPVS